MKKDDFEMTELEERLLVGAPADPSKPNKPLILMLFPAYNYEEIIWRAVSSEGHICCGKTRDLTVQKMANFTKRPMQKVVQIGEYPAPFAKGIALLSLLRQVAKDKRFDEIVEEYYKKFQVNC